MNKSNNTIDLLRGRIIEHYVTCALWSSTDESGAPLDDYYSEHNVSLETLQQMRDDCAAFFFSNRRLLRSTGANIDQHAHDFWLTRCGHGAGFWDRGYGAIGRQLSDAARVFGDVYLYAGEDGKIYA